MIKKSYWYTRLRGKQVYYRLQGYRGLADPMKLVSVPPSEIEWIIPNSAFEDTAPNYGIMDGSWDKNAYKFRNNAIYDQFVSHFKKGVPWEQTDRYQEVIEKIREGEEIGCLDTNNQSVDQYKEYLGYIDNLYDGINKKGYKKQRELYSDADFLQRRPSVLNEVTVFVGRNGQLICKSGKHRITISQLLELQYIPVRLGVRHEDWQSIREEIISAEQKNILSNEILELLDHPDLQDIVPDDW